MSAATLGAEAAADAQFNILEEFQSNNREIQTFKNHISFCSDKYIVVS